MIGPEANHFMLVSGRENFVWRQGRFGDLMTLLGDGLLTTDGDYHDTSRAIMMPSFHRERVAASAETMVAESRGGGRAARRRRGHRHLPLDAGAGDADRDAGAVRLRPRLRRRRRDGDELRARPLLPRRPSSSPSCSSAPARPTRSSSARAGELERTVGAEIAARRALRRATAATSSARCSPRPTRTGRALSDTQVLDHVMTLLFAGHDTTTSTVTFLAYELARNPDWMPRLAGRAATR